MTAIKHDAGKRDYSLLPVEALEEIIKVLEFGAVKYGSFNWRSGFNWTRVSSALLRHTFAWLRGEDKDPESGFSHLAHIGCNALFLLTFVLEGTGKDDRYKTVVEVPKPVYVYKVFNVFTKELIGWSVTAAGATSIAMRFEDYCTDPIDIVMEPL